MMKFYFTPGSCTTGIHILLEELDLLFEAHLVNLVTGDHKAEAYTTLNPKSSIPMLVLEDGEVLTEYQAIAWYLAQSYPKAKLLPQDILQQARVLEMMDYVVATVHMQGFARIFTTEQFCADEAQHEAVKQQGIEIINKAFAVIDQQLGSKDYVSDEFSIADSALFYVEFWADKTEIALPANCRHHYETMRARPVVQRVLLEEGYR